MLSFKVFEEIASKFGTPCYVYEEMKSKEQVRKLRNALIYQPSKILYAMKANFNLALLKILKNLVDGIDAVSSGEIYLGLEAGFKPEETLFTGNYLTDKEIDFAVKKGVRINLDSLSLLERFGKRYPRSKVSVRINPEFGAGFHQHCITAGPLSKFGIPIEQTNEILEIAQKYDIKIVGLHQHIGSQILDYNLLIQGAKILLEIASKFRFLEFIDFGGGLGIPYKPEEKEFEVEKCGKELNNLFSSFCQNYGRKIELWLEPGRYLVGESGYLLAMVTGIKRNPNGRVFVGLDTGSNHLIRPMLYDAYHETVNISNSGAEKEKVDIVGNICENGDIIARGREINKAREGDLLVIKNAGAYGFSMASQYNSRLLPCEVLISGWDRIKLIRKREEFYNLTRTQRGLI